MAQISRPGLSGCKGSAKILKKSFFFLTTHNNLPLNGFRRRGVNVSGTLHHIVIPR